ncbi:neurotrophin 1 [Aphidius gifuensis]|uniref:neurotrophin 1 n=1 Tax=Aphidius gifuensis TaxID=684658 RepID=UPI001CDD8484|nr:neurotrophin 1 [Aphidius gifuensis]XP_044007213.1 neurotrophin 1 [Aphidius gifuensis]
MSSSTTLRAICSCTTWQHTSIQLIRYLVDKCSFNFATVLRDESEFNFNSYRRKPEYHKGYDNQRQYFSQPVTFLRPTYPFVGHSPVIYGSLSNKTANEGYNYSPPPKNSKNPLLLESRSKFERSTSFATFYQHPDWWTTSKQRGRKKRQSSSDTISLCETRTQYIAPRAALNNRGNWMYIVNIADSKEKHSQLVKSEICTSTQCDGICSLPVGYSSKCEQQYVQKRLVALEGTGDRLYTDVFWFPHGCSCQILTSF